jgi:dTDP-4-dehydrorhamnose 3,5-epimerase
MNIIATDINGVFIIEPKVFKDDRGYFFESFRQDLFEKAIGPVNFIQDNESQSDFGVLRGLHYQNPPFTQAKLVRVIAGNVLDIAVDIRKGSLTFGKYVSVELSAENKKQLFIPRGFAHGFLVLSETAIFSYKTDNYYSAKHDRGIKFDDPSIGIDWDFDKSKLIISLKDISAPPLSEVQQFTEEEWNRNK